MIRGERHHKSFTPSDRNPLAAVDGGTRLLSVESRIYVDGDGIVAVRDYDNEVPAVRVDLTPQGIEWLIELIPEGDLFKDHLSYARDLAREALWRRESD